MPKYAAATGVESTQSRSEIERSLERYGASAFGYAIRDWRWEGPCECRPDGNCEHNGIVTEARSPKVEAAMAARAPLLTEIERLLAEVERLKAQLRFAEQCQEQTGRGLIGARDDVERLKATQMPDGGEWGVQYGFLIATNVFRPRLLSADKSGDTHRRRVWYGPAEPIAEVSE